MKSYDKVMSHPAVDEISDEHRTEDRIFVYLKKGWYNPVGSGYVKDGDEFDPERDLLHSVTGETWREVIEELKYVEREPVPASRLKQTGETK